MDQVRKCLPKLRAYFAEFLGTGCFLMLGTMSASAAVGNDSMIIATAFGLALVVSIQIAAPLSGGHLNPAVSLAMALTGNLGIIDAVAYIVAQVTGAIVGSSIVYFSLFSGDLFHGAIEAPEVMRSLVAEIIGTCILVTIVYITSVRPTKGTPTPDKAVLMSRAPFLIGLSVWVLHFAMMSIDGCGVNPARAFGTAVVTNKFANHWVYWVGSMGGSILAVVIQWILFGDVKAILPGRARGSSTISIV